MLCNTKKKRSNKCFFFSTCKQTDKWNVHTMHLAWVSNKPRGEGTRYILGWGGASWPLIPWPCLRQKLLIFLPCLRHLTRNHTLCKKIIVSRLGLRTYAHAVYRPRKYTLFKTKLDTLIKTENDKIDTLFKTKIQKNIPPPPGKYAGYVGSLF